MAAAHALGMLATAASLGKIFVLPSFFASEGLAVPIGFFLPLVGIIGLGQSLSRVPERLERRSRRRVRQWDVLMVALLVTATAAPFLLDHDATWLRASLSLATGMGLVLALKSLPASSRALVPCSWILIGVLTGRGVGHEAWWNWPVATWDGPVAIGWALLALVAGSTVHVMR